MYQNSLFKNWVWKMLTILWRCEIIGLVLPFHSRWVKGKTDLIRSVWLAIQGVSPPRRPTYVSSKAGALHLGPLLYLVVTSTLLVFQWSSWCLQEVHSLSLPLHPAQPEWPISSPPGVEGFEARQTIKTHGWMFSWFTFAALPFDGI